MDKTNRKGKALKQVKLKRCLWSPNLTILLRASLEMMGVFLRAPGHSVKVSFVSTKKEREGGFPFLV